MNGKFPENKLLRYADVYDWLGINLTILRKWVDAGVIREIRPTKQSRSYYDRDEINRKVLQQGLK